MSRLTIKIIVLMVVALSVCTCMISQTGYGAPVGLIYQDTTINHVFPKSTDIGSRMGKSCVISYLGLWSTGDAGIRAAAAEGGITTIRAVDYRIQNISLFYMKTCTIAYGE